METKEIIKKLQECKTPEQFIALQREFWDAGVKGNLGFDFEENRAFINANMIGRIYDEIKRQGISVHALAKCVGYPQPNLQAALKNRVRPIPEKYLNRIIGVLQL